MFDNQVAVRKFALSAARLSGLAQLFRPFMGGVGAILMLHRVTATPVGPLGINRHLAVTPAFLDSALSEMKRMGFHFVTMDEFAEALAAPDRPRRPLAAITLDDGYRDNLVEALPVFERHEVPAIIHVAPALIDGGSFLWWEAVEEIVHRSATVELPGEGRNVRLPCRTMAEKLRAAAALTAYLSRRVEECDLASELARLASAAGVDPDRPRRELLMNWDEIRILSRHPLIEIGAHTISHANLKRLDDEAAWREISGASTLLDERIGRRPDHMAYPYGFADAVGSREVRLAREAGFRTAVTTRHGVVQPAHAQHPHALPRISCNGHFQRTDYLKTMLSGISTPLANRGRRVVTV